MKLVKLSIKTNVKWLNNKHNIFDMLFKRIFIYYYSVKTDYIVPLYLHALHKAGFNVH